MTAMAVAIVRVNVMVNIRWLLSRPGGPARSHRAGSPGDAKQTQTQSFDQGVVAFVKCPRKGGWAAWGGRRGWDRRGNGRRVRERDGRIGPRPPQA